MLQVKRDYISRTGLYHANIKIRKNVVWSHHARFLSSRYRCADPESQVDHEQAINPVQYPCIHIRSVAALYTQLDLRARGPCFEPRQRHCDVTLSLSLYQHCLKRIRQKTFCPNMTEKPRFPMTSSQAKLHRNLLSGTKHYKSHVIDTVLCDLGLHCLHMSHKKGARLIFMG